MDRVLPRLLLSTDVQYAAGSSPGAAAGCVASFVDSSVLVTSSTSPVAFFSLRLAFFLAALVCAAALPAAASSSDWGDTMGVKQPRPYLSAASRPLFQV